MGLDGEVVKKDSRGAENWGGEGGGIPPGSDSQTFTDLETDLPY